MEGSHSLSLPCQAASFPAPAALARRPKSKTFTAFPRRLPESAGGERARGRLHNVINRTQSTTISFLQWLSLSYIRTEFETKPHLIGSSERPKLYLPTNNDDTSSHCGCGYEARRIPLSPDECLAGCPLSSPLHDQLPREGERWRREYTAFSTCSRLLHSHHVL